jgi:hypothetical protein
LFGHVGIRPSCPILADIQVVLPCHPAGAPPDAGHRHVPLAALHPRSELHLSDGSQLADHRPRTSSPACVRVPCSLTNNMQHNQSELETILSDSSITGKQCW